MRNKLTLQQRVEQLELLFEGKQDQERLLNFLGKEYYDKYNLIKNKISDSEYKDIYKLMRKDVDEVKDFIDSFKSRSFTRNTEKVNGAELIYNANGWKVYRITTYKAAQIYGRNTKWCITGNYEGHEERGEEYFYDYIDDYHLDGGYYFYIKSNDEKYCLLRSKSGEVSSIWDIQDNQIIRDDSTPDEIDSNLPDDFPSIDEVFDYNHYKSRALIRLGDAENVKKALELDPSCIDDENEDGYTPLSEYISIGTMHYVEPIKVLLENGADTEVIMPDEDQTMLQFVCDTEYDKASHKIAQYLIEAGADINAKDFDGNQPIHFAAKRDSDELVKLLLKAGADVNSENNSGKTPLHIAAIENSKSSAIVLINNGANVDSLDEYDRTPLDLAIENDNESMIRLLDS